MEERKKKRTKEKKKKKEGGGDFFWSLWEGSASEKKRKEIPPQCLVWFRLNCWAHPKTAKTASSTTGALVGAGSLWPLKRGNVTTAFLKNWNAPRRRAFHFLKHMLSIFFPLCNQKTFEPLRCLFCNVEVRPQGSKHLGKCFNGPDSYHLVIGESSFRHQIMPPLGIHNRQIPIYCTFDAVAMTIDNHCVKGCKPHAILHSI